MSLEFELERFERVTAAPGSVLLRLAGRWYAAEPLRLGTPVLLVESRDASRRLTALPGPEEGEALASARGPAWRAAFSASESVLAGGLSFALDLGPEGIIDLPAPTERSRSGGPAVSAPVSGSASVASGEAAERAVAAATQTARQLTRERDRAVAAATAAERAAQEASRQAERLAVALRSARAEADEAREHAARALEQFADTKRSEDRAVDEHAEIEDIDDIAGIEEIEAPQSARAPARRLPTETAVGLGVVIAAVIAAALLILGLVQVVLSS